MDLLKRVENEKPHFADEKLKVLDDRQFKRIERFSKSDYWCSGTSVNVHDVLGTMHPDYAGNTWLNLLKYGKRMNINLRLLNENPGYYRDTADKPNMEFIKINDEIYIGDDGNHRTCIAKFLFFFEGITTLNGVTVKEYIIDEAFESAFNKFQKIIETKRLPIKAEIYRELVHRADTACWKRDTFQLKALISNHRTAFIKYFSLNELLDLTAESQNPFRCFTGKYKKLWRK